MSSRNPRDWELVGGHPAPGRPEAFSALARDFGDTAERAEDAHRRLVAMRDGTDESIWRGRAADVFRAQLGPLIRHLARLQASYSRASQAMSTYGVRLAELQREADTLIEEATSADDQQRAAVEGHDSAASGDLGAAADLDDAFRLYGDRLRLARERIELIRDDRRAAETRAIDALHAAGELGIRNRRRPAWQRALGSVASVADNAWDATGGRVTSATAGLVDTGWDATGGQLVSGLADFGGDVIRGAGMVADYIGDNWKGLAVNGVLVASGVLLITTGVGSSAGIGVLASLGSSVLSQVLTNGEVDWRQSAISGGIGGAAGGFGGRVKDVLVSRVASDGIGRLAAYSAGGAASGFSGSFFSEVADRFQGKPFDPELLAGKALVGAAFGVVGGAAPSEGLRQTVSIGGSTWWGLVKTRFDADIPLPRPPWALPRWSP